MDTSTLVPVRVRACLCPGAPHADGDFVYLRPKLGLASGIAIQRLIVEANQAKGRTAADLTGVLAEAYLLHGVVEWTFANDRGPVPVNEDTIRSQLLNDFEMGAVVADVADDLYMGPVIAPLLKRAVTSLPSTPSNGSISPLGNGARKPRKRSRRSSTSTIPTAATESTSG